MRRKPQHSNIKGKIENPNCINCKKDGHVASLRSCSSFPKIKPKKGEQTNPTSDQNKNPTNHPSTRPVTANVSYANACAGKNEKQMAPRGEIIASHDEESSHPTTQKEGVSLASKLNLNFAI
ncbi:hypothetical protein TNCT_253451 [Trichonephila clavata]|uniref:Uncharacterized protein n=1 Tax=Trichonephila clavata TaxID=2740835 RepID=A0A8X6H2S3_TRICU|nr:hypothetical protein TNCT_253451 [Trichonephila clavata]